MSEAYVPSPTPQPDPSAPSSDQPVPVFQIHSRLPNLWIGYGFAAVVATLLLIGMTAQDSTLDLAVLRWLLFFAGWIYWMACIYRIHRVLKEATNGSYPVSPRRSVGFQLIPFLSLIWIFKWPKRIAEFVNARTSAQRMNWKLPAFLLLIAAFLGQTSFLAPVHLLILFAVSDYITRKIRNVIPARVPETLGMPRSEHQFNMAISAGVGAVFAFKLFQAVWNQLIHGSPEELFHDVLAITVVSLGVLLFIEPLAERSRSRLGLEEHHARHVARSWRIKVAVFGILAATSLAHGFLHNQIDAEMKSDPIGTLVEIAGATLISGAITYAWVSGARRHKPCAARLGLLTGVVVGLFVVGIILFSAAKPQQAEGSPAPASPSSRASDIGDSASPIPFNSAAAQNLFSNSQDAHTQAQWRLDLRQIVLPWTILGLIGGLIIDKKWGKSVSRTIALALLVAATVFFLAGKLIYKWMEVPYLDWKDIGAYILAVAGWGASLLAFPLADRELSASHPPVLVSAEPVLS
jgi:hypothetical protein